MSNIGENVAFKARSLPISNFEGCLFQHFHCIYLVHVSSKLLFDEKYFAKRALAKDFHQCKVTYVSLFFALNWDYVLVFGVDIFLILESFLIIKYHIMRGPRCRQWPIGQLDQRHY